MGEKWFVAVKEDGSLDRAWPDSAEGRTGAGVPCLVDASTDAKSTVQSFPTTTG